MLTSRHGGITREGARTMIDPDYVTRCEFRELDGRGQTTVPPTGGAGELLSDDSLRVLDRSV